LLSSVTHEVNAECAMVAANRLSTNCDATTLNLEKRKAPAELN
jgi:hypothetical protein